MKRIFSVLGEFDENGRFVGGNQKRQRIPIYAQYTAYHCCLEVSMVSKEMETGIIGVTYQSSCELMLEYTVPYAFRV